MKIYTRTGDDGNTSLTGGKRVPKHHLRIEAYGSVDELISWIGLLRDFMENDTRRNTLIYIQDQLMRCAATLADEKDNGKLKGYFPDPACISNIENEIDKMEANLPSMKNFILPGGHILVSYCNIARCVCRRAERSVLRLNNAESVPDIIYKFLNRLSDYLFVLSRQIGLELDIEEITWSI
jgi:cob(I)alamin adenosyltransferase